MNYLDEKQVKDIFHDFFLLKTDVLKRLELVLSQVVAYKAPNGKKSVRAKLLSNDKDIEIDINFLLDKQVINSSVQSKINDDSFFISEYLDFQKELESRKKLDRKRSEKIDEYLRRYLEHILNLFEQEMNNLIQGKQWVRVPVPDDVLSKYK